MSFAPFLAAPPLIQAHAIAALGALLLGCLQMVARKGTLPHRRIGWLWVALMWVVAVSSVVIVSGNPLIGTFGWIHILSAFTLLTLPLAAVHARRGNIRGHRRGMIALFAGGLVITGIFTLIPGRLMHHVLFGS